MVTYMIVCEVYPLLIDLFASLPPLLISLPSLLKASRLWAGNRELMSPTYISRWVEQSDICLGLGTIST